MAKVWMCRLERYNAFHFREPFWSGPEASTNVVLTILRLVACVCGTIDYNPVSRRRMISTKLTTVMRKPGCYTKCSYMQDVLCNVTERIT